MAKKKKPKVTYKANDCHAYLLRRETVEDGYGGQTIRTTSFIGMIYDRVDAENICAILNKQKQPK